MNVIKKITTTIFVLFIFITFFSFKVSAATGYQGYAVYRDGVMFNYDWHAAIMDEPYSTYSLPVIHHSGSGYVKKDSWINFMNGKIFKGVYKPNSNPSSASRDLFIGMARKLKDDQIGYSFTYQISYDSSTAGVWVDPNEITLMRCDGVVEYCYEYYGHRIFGTDTKWDISSNSQAIRDYHSWDNITPKKQVNYMTLVRSSEPIN